MFLFVKESNRNKNKHKRSFKSLPNPIINFFFAFLDFWQKGARRFACKASLTVEAACVIPLLACFFASILFFFHVLLVQAQVQQALDLTGRKLAVYAGIGQEQQEWGALLGIGVAKGYLQKELAESEEANQWIAGGIESIDLSRSRLEGNYLELTASYEIKFPLHLLKSQTVTVLQKTKARKWTGWNNVSGEDAEEWVYITETGSVYHTTKNCTYLDLSIQEVPYAALETKRSSNGAIYYACPICTGAVETPVKVYITNYGNRYHFDLKCSAMKRTVYMIRKSEAEDRRPCSKCGATGK